MRRLVVGVALLVVGCGAGDGSSEAKGSGAADGGDGGGGAARAECTAIELPPRARASWKAPPPALANVVPGADFDSVSPEEAGFDAAALEDALAFGLPGSRTEAILVVRHGRVVAERTFLGFAPETRHESYSMAKSVTSLLVGIAIDRGLLSGTDERICSHYAEWSCDDAADPRSRITVDHVMNLRTGLVWSEDWRTGATTPNDVFLAGGDLLSYVLSRESVEEPGKTQRYSTGDPALLTAVLEDATGKTALEFGREVLFGPIGVPGVEWASDPKGHTTTYAGLRATAREFARLGLLAARGGRWGDQQLVPEAWVAQTTRVVDPCSETYRWLWHVDAPMRLGDPDPSCPDLVGCMPARAADLPAEAFFALGVAGQMILVVPSADLVAVRLGQDGFTGAELWDGFARGLLERLLGALE